MMCDTVVSSAWQENHPAGERETAFRRKTCRSYLPVMPPSQVHAGVTDDVAGRQKFLRKLLKGLQYVPRVLITDKLASYGAAKREVLPRVEHRQHKRWNNRAENSHQPTRERERRMRRFKDPGHAQRSLAAYGPLATHFRPRRHRRTAAVYRETRTARCATWRAVTGTPALA